MISKNKIKKIIPELRFSGFEDEWEKLKLSKFAKINPKTAELPESFVYIDLESVTNGILKQENIILKCEAPSRAQRVLSKKDILYQLVRPYQKNNLFFDLEGNYVASTGYAQIKAKGMPAYLFQYFHTTPFVNIVMSRSTGTSYPAINSTDLANIYIRVPAKPEQQKIASFLSAVDKKIEKLIRKKELLKQYKKGVMQKIFSQEIRFKDDDGEEFPDWEEKKLGDIITKMQSGISRMLSDKDIGLPILRSNNLQNNKLDISELKFWYMTDDKGANLGNYILQDGDLLVNFINSLAQIGKVAMFENHLDRDTIFTTNLMRLSFKKEILGKYIYLFFQLKQYSNFIQSIAKPAVNQASFTTKDFQKFKINLPVFKEQQKIANFLSNLDKKIESVQKQFDKTKAFKKGLLQKMFV